MNEYVGDRGHIQYCTHIDNGLVLGVSPSWLLSDAVQVSTKSSWWAQSG